MIGLKSLHAVNHVISFCMKCSNSAELIALTSIVLDSTTMYLLLLESLRWNFLPSLWIFFATMLVSHVELAVWNWSIEFSETNITIVIFIFFFSSNYVFCLGYLITRPRYKVCTFVVQDLIYTRKKANVSLPRRPKNCTK